MKLRKFEAYTIDDNFNNEPEKNLHDEIFDWEENDQTNDNEIIKQLSEYTDNEKIQIFDNFYDRAKAMLDEIKDGNIGDEDDVHYIWEDVMNLLAKNRKRFWKYYRSLQR